MWYKAWFLATAVFLTFVLAGAGNPQIDKTNDRPLPEWMGCPNTPPAKWAVGISENIAKTNLWTSEIFIDYWAFHKFSDSGQKFIFFHECGHAHLLDSEIGADAYAYNVAKKQGWLSANLINEVCRSVGSQDGRCSVLRARLRKDNIR